MKPNELYQT